MCLCFGVAMKQKYHIFSWCEEKLYKLTFKIIYVHLLLDYLSLCFTSIGI